VPSALRSGFTLLELIVALAVMLVLAAAVAPNILGRLDRIRVERGRDALEELRAAIVLFEEDVGAYPGRLTQLVEQISQGEPNSCGQGYKKAEADRWDGPYLARVIPGSGLPVAIGTANVVLERQPVGGQNARLKIVVDDVSVGDAADLDELVDGGDGAASGGVEWVAVPGSSDLVTVKYVIPVRGC